MSIELRFFKKIRYDGETGCWMWNAAKDRHGYGHFWFQGAVQRSHRAAYRLFVGPIPEGTEMDHLCRNRGCVNPDHLEPVSHAENMGRSVYAAATHCGQGHEYTPENSYVWRTSRICRTCRRVWSANRNYR